MFLVWIVTTTESLKYLSSVNSLDLFPIPLTNLGLSTGASPLKKLFFDQKLPGSEDYDAIVKISFDAKIKNLDRVLAQYRLHSSNISRNDELIKRIKIQIRINASPRHVPNKILNVKDIPRTKNGKIDEQAVKNIIEGNEVKNKEALANPEILNEFRNLKELKY